MGGFNYLTDGGPFDNIRLPLVEGKLPPAYDEEKGEYVYPEPDPDYEDEEMFETDTFEVIDKDEYWGYPTMCKKCGTEFQAYDTNGVVTRNYCPGCGEKLT